MSWKETDPLYLWKHGTIIPVTDEKDIKERSGIGQRFRGSRSLLWTSLSEMPIDNRIRYLRKLIDVWPYNTERYAVQHSLHISIISTMLSTGIITAKVNADIFMGNPQVKIIESLKGTPKSPVLIGVYSGGLLTFACYNKWILKPLIENEETPCTSCVLGKSAGLSVLLGVVMPTCLSPVLSYGVYTSMNTGLHEVRNHVDLITLVKEFSRSAWRFLPRLVVVQACAGALSGWLTLWGRNRIYDTVDADPEMIRECMAQPEKETKSAKLRRFIEKVNPWSGSGFGKHEGPMQIENFELRRT